MTDRVLTEIPNEADASEPEASADGATVPAEPVAEAVRPEGLPDKFWDETRGQLRADALANSYIQLEQKLGALGSADIPTDPAGYEIKTGNGIPEADAEINSRLHKAGFSQAQAQLVYDLAGEYMVPFVGEMASEFAAQAEHEKLVRHFGGTERWGAISGQIRDWGKANLSNEIFDALSATTEGIKAMHRMMADGEPALTRDGHASGTPESEESLRALMRDPRYWRDHDPAIVDRVQRGFQRLYPDEG